MNKREYLIAAVFAAAVVGVLWTYSRAVEGEITICVLKSGAVRVVGDGFKRSECKKSETLLSWNIQGPAGPKGDQGNTGPQGEKGDTGPQGPAGPAHHVFDNNNNDLGELLDLVESTDLGLNALIYHIFLSDFGISLTILEFAIPGDNNSYSFLGLVDGPRLRYQSSDCAGSTFVQVSPYVPSKKTGIGLGGHIYMLDIENPATIQMQANSEFEQTHGCVPISQGGTFVRMKDTGHVVNLPVAAPLRVE